MSRHGCVLQPKRSPGDSTASRNTVSQSKRLIEVFVMAKTPGVFFLVIFPDFYYLLKCSYSVTGLQHKERTWRRRRNFDWQPGVVLYFSSCTMNFTRTLDFFPQSLAAFVFKSKTACLHLPFLNLCCRTHRRLKKNP